MSSQCAHHPEVAAAIACGRCGTFVCTGCMAVDAQDRCEPCASRTLSYLRGPIAVIPLLRDAVRVLAERPIVEDVLPAFISVPFDVAMVLVWLRLMSAELNAAGA